MVLVSANYKMSFDRLRSQLGGRDLWILVLDTRGVNVWCAAGKGTFGTEELIERIEEGGQGLHGYHSHLHDEEQMRRSIASYYGMTSLMDHHIGRIVNTLK